jgi:uncharacterized membrane protein YgcG
VEAGEALSPQDRAGVAAAVAAAEEATGLQLCVYDGPAHGSTRRHAERLLRAAGARSRPAVMLYVAPAARKVECVVARHATGRISDLDAQRAVEAMLPRFRDGELAEGLRQGLRVLAEAAGPPRGDEGEEELPDVLG